MSERDRLRLKMWVPTSPFRLVVADKMRLEMWVLTGGHSVEFMDRFRSVWEMPYVVIPTPWSCNG